MIRYSSKTSESDYRTTVDETNRHMIINITEHGADPPTTKCRPVRRPNRAIAVNTIIISFNCVLVEEKDL